MITIISKDNNRLHEIETGNKINRDVVSIRSFEHQLYTVKPNKTALTAYYDKLYMIDKNTCSPFGYYRNNIWSNRMTKDEISKFIYFDPAGYGSIRQTYDEAK